MWEAFFASQVAKDMEEGSAAGVSGTPALFINGRFINGAVPFEQISEVIERTGLAHSHTAGTGVGVIGPAACQEHDREP